MIFAILTFIGGVSVNLIPTLEKKFKNRLLTFLTLVYLSSYLLVRSNRSKVFGKCSNTNYLINVLFRSNDQINLVHIRIQIFEKF